MDRYDREERSYEPEERDRPGSDPSGSLGDFPWQDSPGAAQEAAGASATDSSSTFAGSGTVSWPWRSSQPRTREMQRGS